MYQSTFLRLEGALVGAGAIGVAVVREESMLAFALLFLAPDLSMLGYLAGRRVGSLSYNAVHTYLGPGALLATGLLAGVDLAVFAGLIWAAHVGLDRSLGYGLKFADGDFDRTHLQRLDRPVDSPPATPAGEASGVD